MLVYFVPESTQAKDLDALGLRHIYEDPSKLVRVPIFGGPFGMGCVFGSTESISEPQIGYFSDRQTVHNFGKFAIGIGKDASYEPESFARSSPLDSHSWKDANGNQWRIPIARRWNDRAGSLVPECNLPRFLTIDESGEWKYGGVLDRYSHLWGVAATFFANRAEALEKATPGNSYTFEIPDFDEVCSAVFGSNYRVSRYELALFKALTPQSFSEVLSLAVDDPGYEALTQKKTV